MYSGNMEVPESPFSTPTVQSGNDFWFELSGSSTETEGSRSRDSTVIRNWRNLTLFLGVNSYLNRDHG